MPRRSLAFAVLVLALTLTLTLAAGSSEIESAPIPVDPEQRSLVEKSADDEPDIEELLKWFEQNVPPPPVASRFMNYYDQTASQQFFDETGPEWRDDVTAERPGYRYDIVEFLEKVSAYLNRSIAESNEEAKESFIEDLIPEETEPEGREG